MEKKEYVFDPAQFKVKTDVQIRFNDIDILGHLNNVVYFSLFDTGKAEYLRQVTGSTAGWRRVETVIANVNCSFVNSAYFGEPIAIYTCCAAIHDKSFVLRQVMVNSDTLEVKAVCESVMVSFNPDTKTSVSVPEKLRRQLEELEQHPLGKTPQQ